ncbi:hypothetical protein AJ17_01985, partial [Mycobacterium tuberculosis MD16553]
RGFGSDDRALDLYEAQMASSFRPLSGFWV